MSRLLYWLGFERVSENVRSEADVSPFVVGGIFLRTMVFGFFFTKIGFLVDFWKELILLSVSYVKFFFADFKNEFIVTSV